MPIKSLTKFLLDLFFPKKCLGCNYPDTYLCRDCFNKIELYLNNACFFCGKIIWQGKVCFNCRKKVNLDRLISATEYKNPLIRALIRDFKYNYVRELAKPLSQLLIKVLEGNWKLEIENWKFILVPIPLYGTRIRSRGFNQAELLAEKIANYFNLPLEIDLLKRTIPAEPQANIKDNKKREANIKGAFNINTERQVKGKNIILIDDVSTTGATLSEAAKVLKRAGTKEVWGLVVAKG